MRGLAIGFAYLCIYTTPIQIFFIGMDAFYDFQTEYGIFTFKHQNIFSRKAKIFA